MHFEANSQSIFGIRQADLQVVYVKILLLFTPRIHSGSTLAVIMNLITSLGSTEIHSAIIWPIADYSLSNSEKVRSCVYLFLNSIIICSLTFFLQIMAALMKKRETKEV